MAINVNSNIGNIYFHGWQGRLSPIQYQHDTYSRIGQSGSGNQIIRARAPISDIKTWFGSPSLSNAILTADLCESYQGLTWQVQDDIGRSFQRVRVHASRSLPPRGGKGSDLTAGVPMLYLVEMSWQLEVLL